MMAAESQTVQTGGRESNFIYAFINTYETHVPVTRLSFRAPPGKIISLKSQLQNKVIINLAAFLEVDGIFLSRWPTSRAQMFHSTRQFHRKGTRNSSCERVTQTPGFLLLPNTHPAASQ